jgi:hypothetical protein
MAAPSSENVDNTAPDACAVPEDVGRFIDTAARRYSAVFHLALRLVLDVDGYADKTGSLLGM